MIVDEYRLPASGVVADCSQAPFLMEGFETSAFLAADKVYGTNELLDTLKAAHIRAVIPSTKSRKKQRAYNHELEWARHVIENVFRALKPRRRTVARYAKIIASFIAVIHVRCLFFSFSVRIT